MNKVITKKQDEFGSFEVCQNNPGSRRPLVSVVMSTFNNEKSIKESVESILAQSFRDFEFIVIDDHSSDSTPGRLEEFLVKDERLVFVRNNTNLGLTKSLIRGINISRGELIARQDADDYSSKDRLKEELKFMPAFDLVCCRTNVNGKKVSPKFISVLLYRYALLSRNVFVHGTFLFKRKLYEKVGGYNPYFSYAQDYDFITRVALSGFKVKYLKDVLYFSEKGESSISIQCLKQQNEFAGMVKKNYLRSMLRIQNA